MKRYIASEARLLARTDTLKKNKQLFDNLFNEVMYLIEEAARSGEFIIEYDITQHSENIQKTFISLMEEYGYTLNNEKIKW
jgi:hypothetical protein